MPLQQWKDFLSQLRLNAVNLVQVNLQLVGSRSSAFIAIGGPVAVVAFTVAFLQGVANHVLQEGGVLDDVFFLHGHLLFRPLHEDLNRIGHLREVKPVKHLAQAFAVHPFLQGVSFQGSHRGRLLLVLLDLVKQLSDKLEVLAGLEVRGIGRVHIESLFLEQVGLVFRVPDRVGPPIFLLVKHVRGQEVY